MTDAREHHVGGKRASRSELALQIAVTPGAIAGDTSTVRKYLFAPLAPGTYALRFD